MADEIGVAQDFLALVFENVAMDFEDDVVNGQRAGLVGAEHVHRAEVLDGIEPLDDDLLLRHGQRALGQADRDDHRQHFRRQADGDRQREEKRLFPVVLGEAVDDEDQRHHHHHETNHQPGEFLDALVKRRLDLLAGEAAGHLAEISLRAGGDDDRRGRAAFHAGAEKAEVRVLDGRNVRARVARVGFFHRHGFAGQRGLDDEQILGGNQPHIAGNHVAGGQFHHVAGNKLLERDFLRLAVAHDRGGDLDHRLELGRRVVGLRFLDEAQRHPQHHHHQHHRAGHGNRSVRVAKARWPGWSAESPADCGRRSKAAAASSCCFSCATSLGPYCSSRAAASSSLKPDRRRAQPLQHGGRLPPSRRRGRNRTPFDWSNYFGPAINQFVTVFTEHRKNTATQIGLASFGFV